MKRAPLGARGGEEFLLESGKRGLLIVGGRPDMDLDVRRKAVLGEAEGFTDPSFESIAHHSIPKFTRNSDAEFGSQCPSRKDLHMKILSIPLLPILAKHPKLL